MGGKRVIRKFSSHGLGHLTNPFQNQDLDFREEIWKEILAVYYKEKDWFEIAKKYKKYYAISQITVSTPNIWNKFKVINKGKSYENQIKPFNFMLVGQEIRNPLYNIEKILPISPFNQNPQKAINDYFINEYDGKKYKGKMFWNNLENFVWNYHNHPESKFNGNKGVLERKRVYIRNINYIGKERNKIKDTELDIHGVQEDYYSHYKPNVDFLFKENAYNILELKPKDVKEIGISKQNLWKFKQKIKNGEFEKISKKTKEKFKIIINYKYLIFNDVSI